MPLTTPEELHTFAGALLTGVGVPTSAAELTAASLVHANVQGTDSHGVHLLPVYLDRLTSGRIDAAATGKIISEQDACLLFDGQNGLGQVIAARCTNEGARLAEKLGMGLVVARNSNHFGAAGYWGRRMAGEQRIALVVSNGSPLTAPWRGREARLGTNPLCLTVPGTWQLDIATTAAAAGRIREAAREGAKSIPDGWALDKEGRPTTSIADGLAGTLMPLGEEIAGHKGSGLAVGIEMLCAVLGGGAMSVNVGSLYGTGGAAAVSHTFLCIDIARFMPVQEFCARADDLIRMLKSSAPAMGFSEVLVGGEPELRCRQQRLRDGIPIADELWKQLGELASKYKVKMPAARPLAN